MANHGHNHDARRKKTLKIVGYVAAFVVFQAIVIALFVVLVMRVRRPRFRVGDLEIHSLVSGNQSSPSFDMTFTAPIRIKNKNFGPYKYDATTVDFTYGGSTVGHAAISKSKVNFMNTKKIDIAVTLNSSAVKSDSDLATELKSGVLTLNSVGTLTGKVEIFLIFKKKKSTEMNCTFMIATATRVVQSVKCK